jgi:hypothetical protein
MKWMKERDALIAQTKAFVQSVTGRKPEEAIEPPPVALNLTEPVRTGASVFVAPSIPSEPAVSFEPIDQVERTNIPVLEVPPARVLPQSDVRREIQNRVAAFQAHQHRFHREREAYFKSVLTKVRSAIENGSDAPSA